ncbi:MAG: precorrin-6A reductase [Firmicutes bacterium]|nr:precorrin-6A reductase [Bacillota bacterium]
MYNFCLFAGTKEGRTLSEFLAAQQAAVTVCVATAYGEASLPQGENLTVLTGPLAAADIRALLAKNRYDLVIDATHPYAAQITAAIVEACREEHTPYLRLLRDSGDAPEGTVFVSDIGEAADYLSRRQGNILLTTGSKDLRSYTAIDGFTDRVYARVLPMETSLAACREAGLKPDHIIAMQGPFSEEMNLAILRSISAAYLVTKDSGSPGGFAEKAAAAEKAGAQLVVIGRPPQQEGLTYAQTIEKLCADFQLTVQPQVTVAGIGPGHANAVTEEVAQAIREADCLIGAARMLEAKARPGQEVFAAISPQAIAGYIQSHPAYRRFTVIMSGDVGFFSGTKKLLPLLAGCRVRVLPGLSSLVYLCARLQTSYEDVLPVSVHGRDHNIVPDVRANARIFALAGGENGIAGICAALSRAGLGQVRLSVGQRLSYPDEKIVCGTAEELQQGTYDSLSVALIENPRPDAVVSPGLPDAAFQRGEGEKGKVPMTKSEVRAVCLSKLRLTPAAVCWDVGAGTGSVSIEMALLAKKGQVYAIEQNEKAVELLEHNQRLFAADNITLLHGSAPEICRELPAPSHVFIGGSSGNLPQIIDLVLAKNPQARIVATAVTLESIAALNHCLQAFSFTETDAVCLNVSYGRTAGAYHLMTAHNPVYIFTMQGGGPTAGGDMAP